MVGDNSNLVVLKTNLNQISFVRCSKPRNYLDIPFREIEMV